MSGMSDAERRGSARTEAARPRSRVAILRGGTPILGATLFLGAALVLVPAWSCAASAERSAEDVPRADGSPGRESGTPERAAAGDSILPPGDHEFELSHDGRRRSYLVHVPDAGGRLPVLLAFHGGGGNAAQFKASSGFDALADRHGFIAVHPHGTGGRRDRLLTWNAGGCCGRAAEEDVDDVGFTLALIEDLAARTPIDRTRIYASGHSNGAMMAYRLGVDATATLAAIAPVGGAMDVERFTPTEVLAVLHIHSVDDPRALYEGGLGPPFPGTQRRVRHKPVESELSRWIGHDGCPPEPSVRETRRGESGSRDEGHTATLLVWAPCRDGTEVGLLRLTGAGHGWPGETYGRMRERLVGPSTTLIDAAREVWAFVSRFER